jgi:hypothetical protein
MDHRNDLIYFNEKTRVPTNQKTKRKTKTKRGKAEGLNSVSANNLPLMIKKQNPISLFLTFDDIFESKSYGMDHTFSRSLGPYIAR